MGCYNNNTMTKSRNNQPIAYLYLNGLGNGTTKPHEKLARGWWKLAGVELHHLSINWFEGTFEEKLAKGAERVEALLREFDGVVIIGRSAGGSLGLELYEALADEGKNICYVNVQGRVRVGDYPENHRRSLATKARRSPSFYRGVHEAEKTISRLTPEHKKRILVLVQRADGAVPPETMRIAGAATHQSKSRTHFGGFLSHMIGSRDRIIQFAHDQLTHSS